MARAVAVAVPRRRSRGGREVVGAEVDHDDLGTPGARAARATTWTPSSATATVTATCNGTGLVHRPLPRPPPPATALTMNAAPSPRPARTRAPPCCRCRRTAPARRGATRVHGRGRVAERPQHLGARPDPGESGAGAALREVGVLGQQPVAGVDSGAASTHHRSDHGCRVQEGPRPLAVEHHDLVGHADVQRVPLVAGAQRHNRQVQLAGFADHPYRDQLNAV